MCVHVYVSISVCLDVTAYPCVLKRVRTLPEILPSVFVFPSSLFPFVFTSLNLYAHLCMCVCARTYIYMSAEVCWCSFPSVFLALPLERAGYWCAACPPEALHHLSRFTVCPHVCHVCEPLAMSSTNGVIRNKYSKVQQRDPATSHNPSPHSVAAVPTIAF